MATIRGATQWRDATFSRTRHLRAGRARLRRGFRGAATTAAAEPIGLVQNRHMVDSAMPEVSIGLSGPTAYACICEQGEGPRHPLPAFPNAGIPGASNSALAKAGFRAVAPHCVAMGEATVRRAWRNIRFSMTSRHRGPVDALGAKQAAIAGHDIAPR